MERGAHTAAWRLERLGELASRAPAPGSPVDRADAATRHAQHAVRVLGALRDPAPAGLSPARLDALLDQAFPLPFADAATFADFVAGLRRALAGAPVDGALRLIGTSATLFSLNEHKSPDHRFELGGRSDVDLGLESPALSAWLRARGALVEPSPINAGGTIGHAALTSALPAIGDWAARWSATLDRSLTIVATGDGAPARHPSVMDFVIPLG